MKENFHFIKFVPHSEIVESFYKKIRLNQTQLKKTINLSSFWVEEHKIFFEKKYN